MEQNFGWRLRKYEDIMVVSGGTLVLTQEDKSTPILEKEWGLALTNTDPVS